LKRPLISTGAGKGPFELRTLGKKKEYETCKGGKGTETGYHGGGGNGGNRVVGHSRERRKFWENLELGRKESTAMPSWGEKEGEL